MPRISIKGVLIGAVFDFVVVAATGFLLILILSKTSGAETGAELKAFLASSPTVVIAMSVFTTIWIAVVVTVGGYLAAKIARKGALVNGTLSTFLILLMGLHILFTTPQENWILSAVSTAAMPLLGLLGGYLYLRRMRNFVQVRM